MGKLGSGRDMQQLDNDQRKFDNAGMRLRIVVVTQDRLGSVNSPIASSRTLASALCSL